MNLKCFLLILFLLNTPAVKAARILSIFGFPAPAQYAFIEPLLKELAGRGHHITSITNYPQKDPLDNFRDIVIEENKHLFDGFKNFTLNQIEANHFDVLNDIYNKGFEMCLNIMNNPQVRKLLATENFDLIILEVFFTESFFGLSEYLQAPLVGVSTMGTMISIDELVGNISPSAFIPNVILPLQEMPFWTRFLNVVINGLEWMHYYYKYLPVQKQIYKKYFPKAKLSFEQAQRNFALVLVNDHFTLSSPRPYVPNMIEVAGLHIQTKPKPIPETIRDLLDKASDGVIFMETCTLMTKDIVDIFLKQFTTLKQIIIWKTPQVIHSSALNIYISSEFSQSSILAHSNVKLFLTSNGFMSILEGIYHGIPILSLGSTENTDDYIDYVKRIGNGLTLKWHRISDITLDKTLNDLLNNSYYTNYAKQLAKRFRDQQNSPMERAIYWIEYVLRHDGAEHLRNMGRHLTWYQYYNVDILLLLLTITLILICLAYVFIKIFMKFCWKLKKIKYKDS